MEKGGNYLKARRPDAGVEPFLTMWAQKLFEHFHQIYLRQTMLFPQDSVEPVPDDFSEWKKPLVGQASTIVHLFVNRDYQTHSGHL